MPNYFRQLREVDPGAASCCRKSTLAESARAPATGSG